MKPDAFPAPWFARVILPACLSFTSSIPGIGAGAASGQSNQPPDAPLLKPLWTQTAEQFAGGKPDPGSPILWEFFDWTAAGDLLFTEEEIAGVNAYALVSAVTGKVLSPRAVDGLDKLSADGKIMIEFPGQPTQVLGVDLNSPATGVQAYQNGRNCLLMIGRTDGSTMHCGISVPGTEINPAASSPKGSSLTAWTNTAGVVIAGEFVRLESDTLIIRKDGREFRIPLAKLSPACQEQARKLAGSPTSAP